MRTCVRINHFFWAPAVKYLIRSFQSDQYIFMYIYMWNILYLQKCKKKPRERLNLINVLSCMKKKYRYFLQYIFTRETCCKIFIFFLKKNYVFASTCNSHVSCGRFNQLHNDSVLHQSQLDHTFDSDSLMYKHYLPLFIADLSICMYWRWLKS